MLPRSSDASLLKELASVDGVFVRDGTRVCPAEPEGTRAGRLAVLRAGRRARRYSLPPWKVER